MTLSYTAYNTDGDNYSGTVKIIVSNSLTADTITYTTDSDSAIEFDDEDFNDVCNDLTDENLSYVKIHIALHNIRETLLRLYFIVGLRLGCFVKHKILQKFSLAIPVLCELCAQLKLQRYGDIELHGLLIPTAIPMTAKSRSRLKMKGTNTITYTTDSDSAIRI